MLLWELSGHAFGLLYWNFDLCPTTLYEWPNRVMDFNGLSV